MAAKPKKKNKTLLYVLLGAAAIGAGVYFFNRKKKNGSGMMPQIEGGNESYFTAEQLEALQQNINPYIEEILNTPDWLAGLRQQAVETGQHANDVIFKNALYMARHTGKYGNIDYIQEDFFKKPGSIIMALPLTPLAQEQIAG